MGQNERALSDSSADPTSHFFILGESAKTRFTRLIGVIIRTSWRDKKMTLANSDLGENLEEPPPGISTICSTIRSETRSSEESNAVEPCPGRKP